MILDGAQLDVLTEVINIGVGRAAASLSELIDAQIELVVPSVRLCTPSELAEALSENAEAKTTSIYQDFSGEASGRAILVFPRASGLTLAKLLSGCDDATDELDLEFSSILTEVGNILLNGVLGSLANIMEGHFEYAVPQLIEGGATSDLTPIALADGEAMEPSSLVADAQFSVAERDVSGSIVIVIVFALGSMAKIFNSGLLVDSEAQG